MLPSDYQNSLQGRSSAEVNTVKERESLESPLKLPNPVAQEPDSSALAPRRRGRKRDNDHEFIEKTSQKVANLRDQLKSEER